MPAGDSVGKIVDQGATAVYSDFAISRKAGARYVWKRGSHSTRGVPDSSLRLDLFSCNLRTARSGGCCKGSDADRVARDWTATAGSEAIRTGDGHRGEW